MLGCPRTREGILIDPAMVDDLIRLRRAPASHRQHPSDAAHLDHVTGVAAAKRAFGAPVYLHQADQFLYDAGRNKAPCSLRGAAPPVADITRRRPLSFGDFA